MGEHAVSHCVPRIRKRSIDGEQGGISKSVGWKGGGGFRFYRLGPPVFDERRPYPDQDIRLSRCWPRISGSAKRTRPWDGQGATRLLLGVHDGPRLSRCSTTVYSAIKASDGGNVLTRATLACDSRSHRQERAPRRSKGLIMVYGEQCAAYRVHAGSRRSHVQADRPMTLRSMLRTGF